MSRIAQRCIAFGAAVFMAGYVAAADAQTLEEFNAAVKALSVESPAGGPNANPKAAVLVFFRKKHLLCWVGADGKVKSAGVVMPQVKDDASQGGPTPIGEYLIGQRFQHSDHDGIDWYRLYPRIEDNKGYYGYTAKTKTGRFAMGLHPGAISEGCVTIKTTKPYDQDAAWKPVRAYVDSGSLTYKNDGFQGLLYVVDE